MAAVITVIVIKGTNANNMPRNTRTVRKDQEDNDSN